MIKAVGVDIVENSRIRKSLHKQGLSFLRKILTDKEIRNLGKNYTAQHIAGIFAAKEATIKALASVKKINFLDVTIKYKNGRPVTLLNQKIKYDLRLHLSISHEKDYSLAVVICEGLD